MFRRRPKRPERKSRSRFAARNPLRELFPCRFTSERSRIVRAGPSIKRSRTDFQGAVMYPSDYRYTKEHEWIKVSGDTGTIGITDYAQHELGDVVFVELPAPGAKITAGQVFGTVESV